MAKAEKTIITETKIVETPGVQLTLSEDEAWTLATALSLVGGDPDESPRKHTQAIGDALNKEGFEFWRSPFISHTSSSGIRFYESPDEDREGI